MPTEKRSKGKRQGVLRANGKALVPAKPVTLERRAFVDGLFSELNDQVSHHKSLVKELLTLQAKIMITERNLVATRDHLNVMLSHTDEETPKNWKVMIAGVQFIGARLGDACIAVLSQNSPLSTDELLEALNQGQFRWRTGHPLREIHAALLRHPDVVRDREKDFWIYDTSKSQGQEAREEIEKSFLTEPKE